MSLKPGTSQTITRTTGGTASLSGIGTVDKSITKDPATPLEYGRQHSNSALLGTVSKQYNIMAVPTAVGEYGSC